MKFRILATCIWLLLSFKANSQSRNQFKAGFQSISLIDSSRVYKPNSTLKDKLHFRPLDVDIWYPSNTKNGDRLLFEDLFSFFEERAIRYQDEIDYTGLSDELILYLSAGYGVDPAAGRQLLKRPTDSYLKAPVANGTFPLVIYLAGYNGMGWESYRLLERMAEHGFVVMSISSVGCYPGDMTNGLKDTMEQVQDAEFALGRLEEENLLNIDFGNIALLGLSWGAMSGIIMLDRHPDFKAMVSLDGSDNYYYGGSREEDQYLDRIYRADIIHPERTNAAFLHLEAGDRLDAFSPTDAYLYIDKVKSQNYYLRFENSRHEDFASLPWALRSSERQIDIYEDIMTCTVLFLTDQFNEGTSFKAFYKEAIQKDSVTDVYVALNPNKHEEIVLSGRVTDQKTHEGLPYVNIGLQHSDIGTVTDRDGNFTIQYPVQYSSNTLRISMVGYESRTLDPNVLPDSKDGIEIRLAEKIEALDEVVLTAREWKRKTLGNKTKSKFIGHLFYYDQLGKEMGIRLNVRKSPLFPEAFRFHVSHNRFSAKALFRLNMYTIRNGGPAENILKKNIIVAVDPKQTGTVSVDLKEYQIVLTEDIMLTLEWIGNEGELQPTEALAVSVGMFTGGTYERSSKESQMKKRLKGLGLGYTLDVRY